MPPARRSLEGAMTAAADDERRSAEDMDAPLLTQPQTREPTTPQPTVPPIPPATTGVRRVRARGAAASDPDAADDLDALNNIITNRAVVANRRNGHRGSMIPLTMVPTSGLPNSSSLLLPAPVLSDMPSSPLDPSPQLNASSAPQPVGFRQPMADSSARFPIMTSMAPAPPMAAGYARRQMPFMSPATGGAATRLPPRSPASDRARTGAGASAASPAAAGASAATTPNQITQRVEATIASIKRKFDEMGEGVDVDNIRELHHLLTKATIQGIRTNEEHAATFNAMEQLMQMQNNNLIKMDILNDNDFNHTALDFVKHLLNRIAELHHNMLMEKDTTVQQAFSTEKFYDLLLESFKIWKDKKIDLQETIEDANEELSSVRAELNVQTLLVNRLRNHTAYTPLPSCLVCLEKDVEMTLTACGHCFCQPCLQKLLFDARPVRSAPCPTCRKHFKQDNCIKLYL